MTEIHRSWFDLKVGDFINDLPDFKGYEGAYFIGFRPVDSAKSHEGPFDLHYGTMDPLSGRTSGSWGYASSMEFIIEPILEKSLRSNLDGLE